MDPRKDMTTAGLEKEDHENVDLGTQLVKILSNHCGEDGDNEGAVETLERIIRKANALEYAKQRMEISGKLMHENTDNGQLYEFYKGQFLAFRQVIDRLLLGNSRNLDMKEFKLSVTNELVTKAFMSDEVMFGTPNQIISFGISQAYEKYPEHYITNVKYHITHDKLKNITHNWTIQLMPSSEFINQ